MKTVYLGTSEFAAAVLRRLSDSPHAPALVVSRPDRPQGRGRRLKAPPVVEVARELGIDVEQPEDVNSEEARARISAAEPDRVIVCAFGALIREPLLSEHGPILNVHPSLLPRWRGAAPIERSILAGDVLTGVSIMQLTAGLDSGPVCAQESIPIADDDDFGALSAKLEQQGAGLLISVLDRLAGGAALSCLAQDESQATYAEKLTSEDRRLDPTATGEELVRRVRALSPHIGAYVELPDGTRLGVLRSAVAQADVDGADEPDSETGAPGTLILTGRTPVIITADGIVELLIVQPPGKRPMAGEDYLRGLRR